MQLMFATLSAVFFTLELFAAACVKLGHVTALFAFSAFQNDCFPHGFNNRGEGQG
jgi:hypothetical protein